MPISSSSGLPSFGADPASLPKPVPPELLFAEALIAIGKQHQRMQATLVDSSTPEGKIQAVTAELQEGLISVDMACAKIMTIVLDENEGALEPTSFNKSGALFLAFLACADSAEVASDEFATATRRLLTQVNDGQLLEEKAVEKLNGFIDAINRKLPADEHYPQIRTL